MGEYAHRSRDQYDIAWWITAEDPPLVSDQMAQLAQALGLAAQTDTAEHATARVLEALRRRDRWLLIFDDAVSARQLVRFLPPGPGHILVGSPDPSWRAHGTVLPVQRFTRAESIELLQTRLPALEAGEAGRLAAALEDLPLALDLAAATVTATGMSVDTYLRLLSSHRTDGAAQPTPSGAACSVALDRLSVDDPPASALLTIAAWLGRQPVPLSLLTRHADQLPAPLAQTARSPAQLADLAATLRRRGLARVKSNSVQLHRIPADQLLARTVGDRPDQLTWAGWAVRLLRAAMPTQPHDPDGWPVWRQLLPHLLTATDPARHLDHVTLEVGWLLNHAASYLQARGEPRAARALFEDAYDLYRRRLGHDHPDTLASAHTLAQDLHALGQHEQAHRILEDAHLDQA
jgi:tetratricopeptide (TPR) repeat protein